MRVKNDMNKLYYDRSLGRSLKSQLRQGLTLSSHHSRPGSTMMMKTPDLGMGGANVQSGIDKYGSRGGHTSTAEPQLGFTPRTLDEGLARAQRLNEGSGSHGLLASPLSPSMTVGLHAVSQIGLQVGLPSEFPVRKHSEVDRMREAAYRAQTSLEDNRPRAQTSLGDKRPLRTKEYDISSTLVSAYQHPQYRYM